jgi:hypothetical protein
VFDESRDFGLIFSIPDEFGETLAKRIRIIIHTYSPFEFTRPKIQWRTLLTPPTVGRTSEHRTSTGGSDLKSTGRRPIIRPLGKGGEVSRA